MTTHGLELGSLDLVTNTVHDDGYQLGVYADGVTFGTPQAVVNEIVSMLADGSHAKYNRAGNRVVSFDVVIEAPTGPELQAGEAALRRELYRPNTVTWTPPTPLSEPSVYEIVTSEMSWQFDDIEETLGIRVFNVSLTCAPWARSKELVTVAALTVGETPTTVVVDACNSIAGWSGSTSPSTGSGLAAISGFVRFETGHLFNGSAVDLVRAGTISVGTTPYLAIEWRMGAKVSGGDPRTSGGMTLNYLNPISDYQMPDGWRRSVFLVADPLTSITLRRVTADGGSFSTQYHFDVREVSRSNQPPGASPRQMTRTIEVAGTERTPGSLQIVGNQNLGLTIIHTSPESTTGYDPTVVRWRANGETPVADATALSGQRQALSPTSFGADIPVSSLPEGGYLLAARIRAVGATGVLPIDWYTATVAGGEGLAPAGDQAHFDFFDDRWFFVSLAVLTLPSARANDGVVQIDLAGANLELDEAWLFRVDDDCGLTIIDNVPYSRVWIDSPDVTTPVPRYWVGNSADRSDARHPVDRLLGQGNHTFSPGPMTVFTATVGASYPDVSLSHYLRGHSHAPSTPSA